MVIEGIFCCGIDKSIFKEKFEELSPDDKSRLLRVARRFWLTIKLRYETVININPHPWRNEDFRIENYDLPSTELYLLCTCLDTLAGKPKFKDFPIWLEENEKKKQIPLKKVIKLYKRYQDEYGINKNLKEFLNSISDSTKGWLEKNIAPLDQVETNLQKENNIIDLIFSYYFKKFRNKYTHSSHTSFIKIENELNYPDQSEAWVFPISINQDKKRDNITYHKGLDDATILRIIIYSCGLKFIGIDASKSNIDFFLTNLIRIDSIYAYQNEINLNEQILRFLLEDNNNTMTKNIYLESKAAKKIEGLLLANPLESGVRKKVFDYIEMIEGINKLLSEYYKEKIQRYSFKQNLIEKKKISIIEELNTWSDLNFISNLWLIIRDPCYSPYIINYKEIV